MQDAGLATGDSGAPYARGFVAVGFRASAAVLGVVRRTTAALQLLLLQGQPPLFAVCRRVCFRIPFRDVHETLRIGLPGARMPWPPSET